MHTIRPNHMLVFSHSILNLILIKDLLAPTYLFLLDSLGSSKQAPDLAEHAVP